MQAEAYPGRTATTVARPGRSRIDVVRKGCTMSSKPPAWVAGVLSLPRLAPYLNASCGDADAAMRLYWWNVEISAAFFGPLHCVELALRNALHARLAARFGRPDWWATAPLNQPASDTVAG